MYDAILIIIIVICGVIGVECEKGSPHTKTHFEIHVHCTCISKKHMIMKLPKRAVFLIFTIIYTCIALASYDTLYDVQLLPDA